MPATKKELAAKLGIARSSLYYHKKIPPKDELLLADIRTVLHLHPSYGYRRLSIHLGVNSKRVRRVLKLSGIKPYRRRGKKPHHTKNTDIASAYPNLIKGWFPEKVGQIWISDFTYLPFHGRFVYFATVIDLFSREHLGWYISTAHNAALTSAALFHALTFHKPPGILHSVQGVEYKAKTYVELAQKFNIQVSMSKKASPWENGYQEPFYSQFKVDFGDPERFRTLGELSEYLHLRVFIYNSYRIHLSLKASPRAFLRHQTRTLVGSTFVSEKRGA